MVRLYKLYNVPPFGSIKSISVHTLSIYLMTINILRLEHEVKLSVDSVFC